MKKLNEKESKDKIVTEEELELRKVLEEMEEEEQLRDVKVPEFVTERLKQSIATYEAARADVDSQAETQSLLHLPEEMTRELLKQRYPDMTEEDCEIFLAGMKTAKKEEKSAAELEVDSEANLEAGAKVRTFKRKPKKFYVLLVAVFVLSMAVGSIGMGEKFQWLEVGERSIGETRSVAVESDEDIIRTENVDEKAAYEQVSEVLGVTPVFLRAEEYGVEFESVQSFGTELGAVLFYSYGDIMVSYSMVQNFNQLSYNETQVGDYLDSYQVEAVGGTVLVERYEEVDGSITMKGSFTCNNVYYSIKGKVEESDFEEIVKNIIFF